MNEKFYKKPVFQKSNHLQKAQGLSIREYKKAHDDHIKHTNFKIWIDDNEIEIFLHIIQLWREDRLRPKFKDFLVVREANPKGFTVRVQTTNSQTLTHFKHFFGEGNVDFAYDLKGIRNGMDALESSLSRQKDKYYRPKEKGPACMGDESLIELCELFGVGFDVANKENQPQDQEINVDNLPNFQKYPEMLEEPI